MAPRGVPDVDLTPAMADYADGEPAAFEIVYAALAPVGGLLGLAAALAGVGVLQVVCPERSLGHLLVWHGGVLCTGLLLASLLHRILPGPEDGPGGA